MDERHGKSRVAGVTQSSTVWASFPGGSGILMALAMKDFDLCGRMYWGFDSFQGLPGVVEEDSAGSKIVGSAGWFSAGELAASYCACKPLVRTCSYDLICARPMRLGLLLWAQLWPPLVLTVFHLHRL